MLVDINLLPQKERDRAAILIAAVAILLLALAVWALLGMMAKAEANEKLALDAQSMDVAAEQAALRSELDARQGMSEEQQLQATVDWAESYQFDTIPLLDELVSLLPVRGFFQTFSYTGLDQAQLVVQFDSAREAAYYLAQLKASGKLTAASLDNVATEELDEEETEQEMAPRYLATYTLHIQDERIPVEGAEEADGEEITPATEQPADEPADAEAEVSVETEQTGDEAA